MEQVMEKKQERVLERVQGLARDEREGGKREGRVGGWAEVRGPIVVHEQTQPTMQVIQSEREKSLVKKLLHFLRSFFTTYQTIK